MRSPSLRLRLSRSSAHKNHVAPTKYAAITIVQSVNGSVILIVTSNSGEQQDAFAAYGRILGETGRQKEVGLSLRRVPPPK